MNGTMLMRTAAIAGLLVAIGAGVARAQQDVRAQLTARGLPADLADGVASVATDAAARGLPTGPIVDKALEGWAKRAPAPLILAVVQGFGARLGDAQMAVRTAGVATPPGDVIAAAAEAMGRGMTASQVEDVVRAGPSAASVAPALRVASALSAQGMQMSQAVIVVSSAVRDGRTSEQILDMPSAMRAMQSQGTPPADIGRQLMQGGGPGRGGPGPGSGGGEGGMRGPGGGPGSGGGQRPPGGGHGPGNMRPPGEVPPRQGGGGPGPG